MTVTRFELELLPDTLLFEIINYLSPADAAFLIMACKATFQQARNLDNEGFFAPNFDKDDIDLIKSKSSFSFFNSHIFIMQKNLKQAGLCILKGKKDEALELISWDPGLLLHVIPTITLKKYPGHIGETQINRTLYQLALGTYDDELYEAIGKQIESLYGHKVKAEQFSARFPEGFMGKKTYRFLFASLIKTMAADLTIDFINDENIMNDVTREALEDLEKDLEGEHFDIQIITDFIDAYECGFDEFKNDNQRNLYWRCGFGKLESFMSYFVMMALNEQKDFFGVMKGENKITRSTRLSNGVEFFNQELGISHYTLAGGASGGRLMSAMPVDVVRRQLASSSWPSSWRRIENFVFRAQKNLYDLSSNCNNQHTLTTRK